MIEEIIPSTLEHYIEAIDQCKMAGKRIISNNFFNLNQLKDIFERKEVSIYRSENACLLLIPYHHTYLDLIYTANSLETFRELIIGFQEKFQKNIPVRITLIGKEKDLSLLDQIVLSLNFISLKKVARTIKDYKKERKKIEISEEDEYKDFSVDFAKEGEETEVLNLLLEEFKIIDDNIPEIESIKENIKKQQVVVVKKDNELVSCHYFEIKNGFAYGWFDITKKEYRKFLLSYFIEKFLYKVSKQSSRKINRVIGWRDIANKKLLRFAELNREVFDGVFLYTYVWKQT